MNAKIFIVLSVLGYAAFLIGGILLCACDMAGTAGKAGGPGKVVNSCQ